MNVLLITKEDDWSLRARSLAIDIFGAVHHVMVRHDERFDRDSFGSADSVLISFLCPWVLPESLLRSYRIAINFHPGSTAYPGIGCYNFALYDGAEEFGATCHHMAAKVDAGPIILERRFAIVSHETVASLKQRTMAVMLGMFAEIATMIAGGHPLPSSETTWTRKAFTRKDLDSLCRLSTSMEPEEIVRRVSALRFPGYPGASLDLAGIRFVPDL